MIQTNSHCEPERPRENRTSVLQGRMFYLSLGSGEWHLIIGEEAAIRGSIKVSPKIAVSTLSLLEYECVCGANIWVSVTRTGNVPFLIYLVRTRKSRAGAEGSGWIFPYILFLNFELQKLKEEISS